MQEATGCIHYLVRVWLCKVQYNSYDVLMSNIILPKLKAVQITQSFLPTKVTAVHEAGSACWLGRASQSGKVRLRLGEMTPL